VVSEARAAAYYRETPSRFVVPEQLRPYLITVGVDPTAAPKEWEEARRKAHDLARQATDGASFERLARQHSTDPSKTRGGDLGFVHRGRLIDEFESALKTLRPGQMSGVIQTIYGFHLIRLAETRPPVQKSFEEVKQQLIRDLTDTQCSDASARWSKRLREAARIEIVTDQPRAQQAASAGAH
jgi:parvulin-like peptidyl-prolyl isomerase